MKGICQVIILVAAMIRLLALIKNDVDGRPPLPPSGWHGVAISIVAAVIYLCVILLAGGFSEIVAWFKAAL